MILSLIATVYNAFVYVFNGVLEAWWSTCPTGSRWILVAVVLITVYLYGDMRGEQRERRKHRRRRHK